MCKQFERLFPAVHRCAALVGVLGGTVLCIVVAAAELFTINVVIRSAAKHASPSYQALVGPLCCAVPCILSPPGICGPRWQAACADRHHASTSSHQSAQSAVALPRTCPDSNRARLQVRGALGNRTATAMAITIACYLFGSCVAFMIIAADTTHALLTRWSAAALSAALASRPAAVLLPAALIMLPLSLQRTMGALAPASTLAVFVMALTSGAIALRALQAPAAAAPEATPEARGALAALAAVPIMVFAYQCHVQAVPIFTELSSRPRLWPFQPAHADAEPPRLAHAAPDSPAAGRGSSPPPPSLDGVADAPRQVYTPRKVAGMAWVVAAASAECTILYLVTGAAGARLFPAGAQANVLNDFAAADTLMQVVRVFVGLAVTLHYPINLHAARTAAYDLFCEASGRPLQAEPPYAHVAATSLALWGGTAATACAVSDLGSVFQIIGGVAGSVIIFVLPGAILAKDAWALRRGGGAAAADGRAAPVDTLPLLPASALDSTTDAARRPVREAGLRRASCDIRAGVAAAAAPDADATAPTPTGLDVADQYGAPAPTQPTTLFGMTPLQQGVAGCTLVVVGVCVMAIALLTVFVG